MTLETSPQPGRPVMTAPQAARTLRKDLRTVRRMIERGELAGGAEQGPKYQRWYVYADQLTGPAVAGTSSATTSDTALTSEIQRLQASNAELRAKLLAAEDTNRVLLAAQATQREAFIQYRQSVDDILAGAAGYRAAAEHFERATTGLQTSGAMLTNVIDNYGEALIQYGYEGNLGSLLDSPTPPDIER